MFKHLLWNQFVSLTSSSFVIVIMTRSRPWKLPDLTSHVSLPILLSWERVALETKMGEQMDGAWCADNTVLRIICSAINAAMQEPEKLHIWVADAKARLKL